MQIIFGEFDKAEKPKTSHAKYLLELNSFTGPQRPHRIPFLLGRPYKLLYVRRRLAWYFLIFFFMSFLNFNRKK